MTRRVPHRTYGRYARFGILRLIYSRYCKINVFGVSVCECEVRWGRLGLFVQKSCFCFLVLGEVSREGFIYLMYP